MSGQTDAFGRFTVYVWPVDSESSAYDTLYAQATDAGGSASTSVDVDFQKEFRLTLSAPSTTTTGTPNTITATVTNDVYGYPVIGQPVVFTTDLGTFENGQQAYTVSTNTEGQATATLTISACQGMAHVSASATVAPCNKTYTPRPKAIKLATETLSLGGDLWFIAGTNGTVKVRIVDGNGDPVTGNRSVTLSASSGTLGTTNLTVVDGEGSTTFTPPTPGNCATGTDVTITATATLEDCERTVEETAHVFCSSGEHQMPSAVDLYICVDRSASMWYDRGHDPIPYNAPSALVKLVQELVDAGVPLKLAGNKMNDPFAPDQITYKVSLADNYTPSQFISWLTMNHGGSDNERPMLALHEAVTDLSGSSDPYQFILLVTDEKPHDSTSYQETVAAEVNGFVAAGGQMYFSLWPVDTETLEALQPIYEALEIDGAVFDPPDYSDNLWNDPLQWPFTLLRQAILGIRP